MARAEFKLDDIQLKKNLKEFGPEMNKRITLTTDKGGTLALAEMKKKAPWIDRTTNARTGLNQTTSHTGSGALGFKVHTITLAHGVRYGIWLEKKSPHRGGRPIVVPTMLSAGKQIMDVLRALLNDVGPSAPNIRVPAQPQSRARPTGRQRAEAQSRTRRSGGTKPTGKTRRTPRV